jgi:hypothetical protein
MALMGDESIGVLDAERVTIDEVVNGLIFNEQVCATDGIGFRVVVATVALSR